MALQWSLPKPTGIDGLKLDKAPPTPPPGDDEVTIELHAASLNYRELVISKNAFPPPFSGASRPGLIPGSDGAGVITHIGKNVTDFKVGDRVVTHICPHLDDEQPPAFADTCAGLGHSVDGTLRQEGNFHHKAAVRVPANLSFEEAATLTCSGLTAFNALFGLEGRAVKDGDWVLVQGTGGVSVAALQLAIGSGAKVVATTSSDAKAERLRQLGATEVLNYRSTPDWGKASKRLTPDGRGFDMVVDVGGDATLGQAMEAVKVDGTIVATGMLGGQTESSVPMMSALVNVCTVRGIIVGTRRQFEGMVRMMETLDIHPAVDERVFGFEEVPEAMRYLEKQQHFSKIVIKLR